MIEAVITSASAACEPEKLIRIQHAQGDLIATIAPDLGGELVGLDVKHDGAWVQLLYRGMNFCPTEGWVGKAPILWPATGRNFIEDPAKVSGRLEESFGWHWRGQRYPMPIHGFARTSRWHVERVRTAAEFDRVTLSLSGTPETMAMYPFRFRFDIEYIAGQRSLQIRHRITAATSNESVMPFSIGNHLTFRHPLLPGDSKKVAALTSPLSHHLILDTFGRPEHIETIRPFVRQPLTFFARRSAYALVGDASRSAWARWDDPSGISILISHASSRAPREMPVLFNLWGDLAEGYFSIEPWNGRQNSLASGQGAIELPPGEEFEWNLDIEIDGVHPSTQPDDVAARF